MKISDYITGQFPYPLDDGIIASVLLQRGISDNEMQRVQSGHVNYVKIEVDEEYNSETALTTAVRQYEHLPIFSDDKIGVMIKPVYSQTNVNINFKF